MSHHILKLVSALSAVLIGLTAFDARAIDVPGLRATCNSDDSSIWDAPKKIAATKLYALPDVVPPLAAELIRAKPLSACGIWVIYERERCGRGQAGLKAIEKLVDKRAFLRRLVEDLIEDKQYLPFEITYNKQHPHRSKWLRILFGDNAFERATAIHSYRQEVDDATLCELAALTGLEQLDLVNADITDDGLLVLFPLKRLRRLYVSSRSITDRGIAHLSGLMTLKEVSLLDTKVTGTGFVGLCQLDEIQVSYSQINDDGIRAICGIKGLQSLHVTETQITDEGLKELPRLTNLRFLDVESISVTVSRTPESPIFATCHVWSCFR